MGQVIAPNTTKYISLGKTKTLQSKILKFLPMFLLGGTAISCLLYLLFPMIIKLLFSKYYTESFLTIMLVLLVLLPIKLWGVFLTNGLIIPSGFAKIITVTTLIGGALNIILDFIFINWLGYIGVFWVTLIIHSLNIIIVTLIYWSKINKYGRKIRS